MGIKDKLGSAWKWAKRLYIGAFILTNLHIGYDYITRDEDPSLTQANFLKVEEFGYYDPQTGQHAHLTLYGEVHCYSKQEEAWARGMVDYHENFAFEAGSDYYESKSLDQIIQEAIMMPPAFVSLLYFNLGSDRNFLNLSGIAEEKGYYVHPLDVSRYKDFTIGQRIKLVAGIWALAPFSPSLYYVGKEFSRQNLMTEEDESDHQAMIASRDSTMANEIVKIFRENKYETLCAGAGIAHFEGIKNNLKKVVILEPRERPP